MAEPAEKLAPFSGATVGPEEIAARAGFEPNQRQAMSRWLDRHHVRYFLGRDGPWTTVEALNKALGVSSGPNHPHDPITID